MRTLRAILVVAGRRLKLLPMMILRGLGMLLALILTLCLFAVGLILFWTGGFGVWNMGK